MPVMTYPLYLRLLRAKATQIIEEIAAASEDSCDMSAFYYGSGKDGSQEWNDGPYLVPNPVEFTTFSGNNLLLAVSWGWPSPLDVSATTSINLSNAEICAAGDSGASGDADGTGGYSGGGSMPGTDGADGGTTNGSAVPSASQINMSAPNNEGHRATGGSGGEGFSGVGGIGGSDGDTDFFDADYYHYPFFNILRQPGVASAHPISVGGYGGGGGAGNGEDAGGHGGGGGGGGGAVILRAPSITLTDCLVSVSGGDGGGGQTPGGANCGGGGAGGGGNGGIIVFVCETLSLSGVTYAVNGGAGGAGGSGTGTGAAGGNGENGAWGQVWWYRPSTNEWTDLTPVED